MRDMLWGEFKFMRPRAATTAMSAQASCIPRGSASSVMGSPRRSSRAGFDILPDGLLCTLVDLPSTGEGWPELETTLADSGGRYTLCMAFRRSGVRIPSGSTTTTSGIHQAPLRSWCRLRRRVLRGFRHDHGSRDDSDRVLPVSRCHEYGACGSDLAQHGRDRIDQGAAICARMASLQRGLG